MGRLRNQRSKNEGTFLEHVRDALEQMHAEIIAIKSSVEDLRKQSTYVSTGDLDAHGKMYDDSFELWGDQSWYQDCHVQKYTDFDECHRVLNVLAEEFVPAVSSIIPKETLLAHRNVDSSGDRVIAMLPNASEMTTLLPPSCGVGTSGVAHEGIAGLQDHDLIEDHAVGLQYRNWLSRSKS